MKRIFTLLAALVITSVGFGQVAAWNVFGDTAWGAQGKVPSTLDANLTSEGLKRGDSVRTSGTAGKNLWGGSYWSFGTAQQGIDSLRYITFSVATNSSATVSLTGLDSLRIRTTKTGPISFLLQYSLNGGSFSDIYTYTITRPTATTNTSLAPLDLSNVAGLQNVPPSTNVTFRLVPYGTTSTSGAFYFGNQASANHIAIIGAITLPVSIASIKAVAAVGKTTINWSTGSELNFSYFTVEKSTNGSTFIEAGRVASKGIATGSSYSFVDLSGAKYYRVKIVDKDGSFRYSQIISVAAKAIQVSAFPNPAVNSLSITHGVATSGGFVKIISIDGKTVSLKKVEIGASKTTVDVASLKKGAYIAVVNDGTTSSNISFVK